MDQLFPGLDVGLPGPDVEKLENFGIETFLMKMKGNLVNCVHINSGDNCILGDVAEQGDLGFQLRGERHFGPADQNIGLDAVGPQFPDRVLGEICARISAAFSQSPFEDTSKNFTKCEQHSLTHTTWRCKGLIGDFANNPIIVFTGMVIQPNNYNLKKTYTISECLAKC